MGYQKIQAKRKELYAKREVYEQFLKAANTFNSRLTDIKKAQENLEKQRKEMLKAIEGMKPSGVQEFESLQKEMRIACNSDYPEAVSTSEADKFMKDLARNIEQEMDEYVNKLCGSFPSKIQPGMTFKNYTTKQVAVVTSGPTQATNANLKGDDAIWFDLTGVGDNRKYTLSQAMLSPKKGWKFVNV